MAFVIAPPSAPAVAVAGSDDLFPVHRVYCVGRNYADHAREMGHDPDREAPFFFQKSPDNLLPSGPEDDAAFPYPPKSENVHHEIELVAALSGGGTDIAPAKALDLVWGYGVGLDMTRRDLQGEAKKAGRPWDSGKAFENSAPIGPIHPVTATGHPSEGRVWLDVNGETRQDGNINQLIWSLPEIIAHLSGLFELKGGDLIFTGTPAGVGAVERGDVLEGGVEGIGEIKIKVT
ncbi:MAG: fumarylacetoacetate hydrolase family protein [Rhodospirillales bacterium]|nr:fumarylacetoacetate hydrolase family protein [Rhodospirillales bacterium]